MVEGAALEKRCAQAPWVRIPPSPPCHSHPTGRPGADTPTERSPRGLGRRTGNAVWGNPSRVRIPPSPPPPSEGHRWPPRSARVALVVVDSSTVRDVVTPSRPVVSPTYAQDSCYGTNRVIAGAPGRLTGPATPLLGTARAAHSAGPARRRLATFRGTNWARISEQARISEEPDAGTVGASMVVRHPPGSRTRPGRSRAPAMIPVPC